MDQPERHLQRIKQRACFHHFTWLFSGNTRERFPVLQLSDTGNRDTRDELWGVWRAAKAAVPHLMVVRQSLALLSLPVCSSWDGSCRGSTWPSCGVALGHSKSVSWGAALCLGTARLSSPGHLLPRALLPSALGTHKRQTSVSKNSAYPDKSAWKYCLWTELFYVYLHGCLQAFLE